MENRERGYEDVEKHPLNCEDKIGHVVEFHVKTDEGIRKYIGGIVIGGDNETVTIQYANMVSSYYLDDLLPIEDDE